MPPALARFAAPFSVAIAGGRSTAWIVLGLLHGAALGVLLWSETDATGGVLFVLAWGLLNFVLIAVLRRPIPAAGLSLALVAVLILLSRFKHGVVLMTVNFLDVLIVDPDTISFLLTIYPDLARVALLAGAAMAATLALLWWLDPLRLRMRRALLSAGLCLAGVSGVSLAVPHDLYDEFVDAGYLSKFARTGVTGVVDLYTRGYFESDAVAADRLAADPECRVSSSAPHIVMVFDESSFDITQIPSVRVPEGYRDHFRSSDGMQRRLLVEGAGGPSWYTEYNVLAGLSVRSFGRFADLVTRVASGRVERGLPRSLARCGYRTYSLYPMWGAFAGARKFQQSLGIQHFLDAKDLGMRGIQPDSFYYDAAADLIGRERGAAPLFLFVYTAANHFPWNFRYKPERIPEWRDSGNSFEVDEYLRRQAMSAKDYRAFVQRLERDFPSERFLIVRFGDHQPSFAKHLIDPSFDDGVVARRLAEADPRYLTTYYTLEVVNFRPVETSSALDRLDAPFLPIAVMEAAGVPLDASFAEQKRILQRCGGLFYRCATGAETRRFNRLLIDAGLIKRL
jgi:phosphoglycerol transferase MdoB-like AlkP superfamily enzyme